MKIIDLRRPSSSLTANTVGYPNDIIIIIIIIYSFNVKLTSATFNNASTRYIINLSLKKHANGNIS